MNSHVYGQFLLKKGTQTVQWVVVVVMRDSLFAKWTESVGYPNGKLIHCAQKLKQIDWSVKAESMKLSGNNKWKQIFMTLN